MSNKVLLQGNEACVEGALAAGMRLYAGYPITPSTEIAEISAEKLPLVGGKFIQMEDEIAGIAAAIGASAAGVKSMTATSGPGFSLKQENIGYACVAEIPVVIVDVQRSGPSTGIPTAPSQGDVMQAKWGTHGDHPVIALSPSSVRETYDMTITCFNLAERYRTPVILLMDEIIGHLREGITLPSPDEIVVENRKINRQITGKQAYIIPEGGLVPEMAPFGQGQRYNMTGLFHDEMGFPSVTSDQITDQVQRLLDKVEKNRSEIEDYETFMLDDAEICLICYGGTTGSARSAILEARQKGIKAGLFRPKTIWPFPESMLDKIMEKAPKVLVVEHNAGQLLLEIERIVRGRAPVSFLGRINGTVIMPGDILEKIEEVHKNA